MSVVASHGAPESWIGARLLRKEDSRFLKGVGQYIDDVRMAGLLDIAFVRSPVAHGRLRRIVKPAGAEDRVFTLADLGPLTTLEAGPELAAFRASGYLERITGERAEKNRATASSYA